MVGLVGDGGGITGGQNCRAQFPPIVSSEPVGETSALPHAHHSPEVPFVVY